MGNWKIVNTEGRVTPPKRFTSPTWGPPPPCKQTFSLPCRRSQGFVMRFFLTKTKNKSTLFECQCIEHESINWGYYFFVFKQKLDRHFTWSSESRESLAACSAKGVSSFLSYLSLRFGPVLGIEPATTRSTSSALLSLSCQTNLGKEGLITDKAIRTSTQEATLLYEAMKNNNHALVLLFLLPDQPRVCQYQFFHPEFASWFRCSDRCSYGVVYTSSDSLQKVDSAIHRINDYPLDSAIDFPSTYPLDSDLSGGQRYPTFEQLGPEG